MHPTRAPDPDAPGRPDGTRAVAGAGVEAGTVRTTDVATYYERRGSGPPIVFVHGMAMSTAEWDPQAAALAGEFTTVAYDVRGHGHTGGSDRAAYSMDLYAVDLDALLAALDVERPVVCGLSMGGCIAQAYAATHPEHVAGLVLADTFTAAPLPFRARLLFANLRVLGLLDRVVRYTTLNRVQTWIGDRLAPGVAGDGVTTQRLMEAAPGSPTRSSGRSPGRSPTSRRAGSTPPGSPARR
jgi:pimeloyl-ACP methyl ester carboxylesterase